VEGQIHCLKLIKRAGYGRASAVRLAILVCVDGLASYVTAFRKGFRHRTATGKPGRPRLAAEEGLLIGQVIKQYAKRRVTGVKRRIVQGTQAAITAVLEATKSGTDINTAYIERLNATFRSALAVLVRRGRAIAHTETVLNAGMWLVGTCYNLGVFAGRPMRIKLILDCLLTQVIAGRYWAASCACSCAPSAP
jgi:hypothetical protein